MFRSIQHPGIKSWHHVTTCHHMLENIHSITEIPLLIVIQKNIEYLIQFQNNTILSTEIRANTNFLGKLPFHDTKTLTIMFIISQ